MGTHYTLDLVSRVVASCAIVIFIISTAIGSALPEFGNILAARLGIWSHSFNILFLILGIVGVSVALYFGYTRGS